MDVTLLLCDAAQESNGKLYVLGGGWNQVKADQPVTQALAVLVEVPWDLTNRKMTIAACLMTEDGDQVQAPDGQAVELIGDLEVGRPPGTKPGSSINVPFALTFNGVVIPSGGYRWEVKIDGDMQASAPFRAV